MKLMHAGKSLLVSAVAVGALSLGAAGVAGAATPASTPSPATRLANFNCANATKALNRIDKLQSDITAGLPKLNAAEAKAVAAGHTRRADRLKRVISRLESPKAANRLTKAASAIEAKCHVAAPTAS